MTAMPALTHLSAAGQAHMVDVSGKAATERVAVAEGRIVMQKATLDLALSGNAKKGDIFAAARIAAIMAAKKTHDLIPLCHPLALTKVEVDLAYCRALTFNTDLKLIANTFTNLLLKWRTDRPLVQDSPPKWL